MTQVKINLSNAIDAQMAINAVLSVQLKLEKIVAAMQHTDTVLDHKYLMNYIVGNVGNSVMVSTFDMMEECSNLTARLAAAGVIELHSEDAYAEVAHATLDYMIDEKMHDDKLIIKGSEIRYKLREKGKKNESWKYLPDSVQVIITRLEVTEEDRKDFSQRKFRDAMNAVVSMGYTIDESGMLVVV